jgi:uncharacterized tellurite resistance protein B-like protein
MKVRDRVLVLTDLFMGALWADEEFSEDEQRAVRRLLGTLLAVPPEQLPDVVEERIRAFDPLKFDLEGAARDFEDDPPMAKRRLLELVGMMVNADGKIEVDEDEYLRRLASALGVEYGAFSEILLSHEPDELRQTFEALRNPPPPMVTEAGRSSRPPPPPIVDPSTPPAIPHARRGEGES